MAKNSYSAEFVQTFGEPAPAYQANRACVKCGAHNSTKHPYMVSDRYDQGSGLMHRTCTNCGYSWNELPKDEKSSG